VVLGGGVMGSALRRNDARRREEREVTRVARNFSQRGKSSPPSSETMRASPAQRCAGAGEDALERDLDEMARHVDAETKRHFLQVSPERVGVQRLRGLLPLPCAGHGAPAGLWTGQGMTRQATTIIVSGRFLSRQKRKQRTVF